MTPARPVGIWIRVSTEDQVRGESPAHHEERARGRAEAKGWQVVEVYRLDALSGKSVMGFAETQRMLADVQAGRITALIFSKVAPQHAGTPRVRRHLQREGSRPGGAG